MGFNSSGFARVAEVVAPIAMTMAGVPPGLIPLAVHGIQMAETLSQAKVMTGAEKKAAAVNIVKTGLEALNVAKPNTVDVTQLTGVVSSGIDTAIAAINAAKNIPVHTPNPAKV